jgi:hypothetical protein
VRPDDHRRNQSPSSNEPRRHSYQASPRPDRTNPGATRHHPGHLISDQQALAWFTTERPVLLAVDDAAGFGFDSHTWELAWALFDFLDWRGHWHDLATTQHSALAAARRRGDLTKQANARRLLARACLRLERPDDAKTQLWHALNPV